MQLKLVTSIAMVQVVIGSGKLKNFLPVIASDSLPETYITELSPKSALRLFPDQASFLKGTRNAKSEKYKLFQEPVFNGMEKNLLVYDNVTQCIDYVSILE